MNVADSHAFMLWTGLDWIRRAYYKKQELLTLCEHLSSPPVFWWGPCCSMFFFSIFVLFYCVFTFLATCSAWCPLRFPMFDSSLSPVVCGRTHVLFDYVICVWLGIVLSNTYCVVLLFCLSSSCVLCVLYCQFAWVVYVLLPFDVLWRFILQAFKGRRQSSSVIWHNVLLL